MAVHTLGAVAMTAGPAGVMLTGQGAATAATRPGTTAMAAAASTTSALPQGYTLPGADGGVFNFHTNFYGNMYGQYLAAPIVGAAGKPDGSGYWLVGADGGVFSFGGARFYGSLSTIKLHAPIVGIASTPDGHGYWLAGADGGIFAFGDARFMGSLTSVHLAAPVVGIANDSADRDGYLIAAADGGLFALGHAAFHGSAVHAPLRGPIVGVTPTPDGNGYWLAGQDGGVFTYGSARFFGSRGTAPAPFNVVGIQSTPSGNGYWMATSTGTVYRFGDAAALGDLTGKKLSGPVVGITGRAPLPGVPAFMASYPRPLWVGVTTDTTQGGVGGDDTPTFSNGSGGPYKAALAAGTQLPPGLLLESDGTIRGDAAAPGNFTVVFTDAKGNQTSVPVSVGYAPTGDIATLAGGLAPKPANTNDPIVGQTTLPPPDSRTVASGPGTTYPGGNGDGGASTGSQVYSPEATAVGPDGSIYFIEVPQTAHSSGSTGEIRRITPDGIIHTFAGGGTTVPTPNGTAPADASFQGPSFIGVDSAGNVVIGDHRAEQIYVIPARDGTYYDVDMTAGEVYPITGPGTATPALASLSGMAVAPDGTLYWSDSSSGQVHRFAIGDASPSVVVDTSTAAAPNSEQLQSPGVLAVDPSDGTLYLANQCSTCANNSNGDVIESLTTVGATPTLTDIAPGSQWGTTGLAVDSAHNVYISDLYGVNGTGAKTLDDLVLKVAPGAGKAVVVAGTSPAAPVTNSNTFTSAGYQNGVDATTTGVDSPFGLSYDSAAKTLVIAQTPSPFIGGVGAKGVRIVSNPAAVTGVPYVPGKTLPLV